MKMRHAESDQCSGSVGESEDDLVDKAVRVERGNLYAFLEEDVLRHRAATTAAPLSFSKHLIISATHRHPLDHPLR